MPKQKALKETMTEFYGEINVMRDRINDWNANIANV